VRAGARLVRYTRARGAGCRWQSRRCCSLWGPACRRGRCRRWLPACASATLTVGAQQLHTQSRPRTSGSVPAQLYAPHACSPAPWPLRAIALCVHNCMACVHHQQLTDCGLLHPVPQMLRQKQAGWPRRRPAHTCIPVTSLAFPAAVVATYRYDMREVAVLQEEGQLLQVRLCTPACCACSSLHTPHTTVCLLLLPWVTAQWVTALAGGWWPALRHNACRPTRHHSLSVHAPV
jgi:hypothetical protein